MLIQIKHAKAQGADVVKQVLNDAGLRRPLVYQLSGLGSLGWRRGYMTSGAPAMRALARRFLRDQAGATAIEYAMIAAGVAGAVVAAVQAVGTAVLGEFTSVQGALNK